MAHRETHFDLNQLAVRSTRAKGGARGSRLSASLPHAMSKAAYYASEAPKLRNSMNNADLLKSDKIGSFHGGVLVKRSPSTHSNPGRDPAGIKPRTASGPGGEATAADDFEKSPVLCHSNMVTNGSKKGGGKGKSQLTLYINSRPPNGECETAHEASVEEDRSQPQSLQQNWRSGENLIDAADAAVSGTDLADAARSAVVGDERKATRSDDDAAQSMERGTVAASDYEAKSPTLAKVTNKMEPLHTQIAEHGRNDPETILREPPGSDRDCQVTSGQFSDLHQTYYLVEMDMNDPEAPQLDSIKHLQGMHTKPSRQSRGYKTKGSSSKNSKNAERTNSETVAQPKSQNPFAEHSPSVHTMQTQSSQVKELSVRKEVPGMQLCIHRRNNLPHSSKKGAQEGQAKQVTNWRFNLKERPGTALHRAPQQLKVTLGAFPRRKKLTSNPPADGRCRRDPHAPRRADAKAKTAKRSMEGSSLQPIRSGEQQCDNDYQSNQYAANSYYQLINKFADQTLAAREHKPGERRQRSSHQIQLDSMKRNSLASSKANTGAFCTQRDQRNTATQSNILAEATPEGTDTAQGRPIQILLQQPEPEQTSSKKHSRLSSAQARPNRDLSSMATHVDGLAPVYGPDGSAALEDTELFAYIEQPAPPQMQRTIPHAMKGYLTNHINHIPQFTQEEIDDRKTAIKLPNRGNIVKVVYRDNRKVSEPYDSGTGNLEGIHYSRDERQSDQAFLSGKWSGAGSAAHPNQARRESTNNSIHELTPSFKEGVYRFGQDGAPALHGGTMPNEMLSVQQKQIKPKNSLNSGGDSPGVKSNRQSSKASVEEDNMAPLTNPKITTEVYLSKVKMLTPSKRVPSATKAPGAEDVSLLYSGDMFSKKVPEKSGIVSEANEVQTVNKSSDQQQLSELKDYSSQHFSHLRAAPAHNQGKTRGIESAQSASYQAEKVTSKLEVPGKDPSGAHRVVDSSDAAKQARENVGFSSQRPSSIDTGKQQIEKAETLTQKKAKRLLYQKCETQPSATNQQNMNLSTLPMQQSQNLSQFAAEGKQINKILEEEDHDLQPPGELPGISSEELLVDVNSPDNFEPSPTIVDKMDKKWTNSEHHHTFDGRANHNATKADQGQTSKIVAQSMDRTRVKSANAAGINKQTVKSSWQTAGMISKAKKNLESNQVNQQLLMEKRSYSSEGIGGIASKFQAKTRESFPGSFGATKKKAETAGRVDWEVAKPLNIEATGRAHSNSSYGIRGSRDNKSIGGTQKAGNVNKDFELNDKTDRFGQPVETTELTPNNPLRATTDEEPESTFLAQRVFTEEPQSALLSKDHTFTFEKTKKPKVDQIIRVTSQRRANSIEKSSEQRRNTTVRTKGRYDRPNTGHYKLDSSFKPGLNTGVQQFSDSKPSPKKSPDKDRSAQFNLTSGIPPRQNSPEIYRKNHVYQHHAQKTVDKQKAIAGFNKRNEMNTIQVQRPQPQQLDRPGSIQEMASQVQNMHDLLVVQQYESSEERNKAPATSEDPVCQTMTSEERILAVDQKKEEIDILKRRMSSTGPQKNPSDDTSFLTRMQSMENRRQQKLSQLRRARPQTVQSVYQSNYITDNFNRTEKQSSSDYIDQPPMYLTFLNRHERLKLKEQNAHNASSSSIASKKSSETSIKDRIEVKRDIKQACKRSISQIKQRLQLQCQQSDQSSKDALKTTQLLAASLESVALDLSELDVGVDSAERAKTTFIPQPKQESSSSESLVKLGKTARAAKDLTKQRMKQTKHMIKLQPKRSIQKRPGTSLGGKDRTRYPSSKQKFNIPSRVSQQTSQEASLENTIAPQTSVLDSEMAYSIGSYQRIATKPKGFQPLRQVSRIGQSQSAYIDKLSLNEYTNLRKQEKEYYFTNSVSSDRPLRNLLQHQKMQ